MVQSGPSGGNASVFIRGTNSNHVLVLRDVCGLTGQEALALPGPTDEVLLGLGALLKGLAESEQNKVALAERIATVLRARLQEKVHAHP